MKNSPVVSDLMSFLDASTCNFYAVDTISRRLDQAGFSRLDPVDAWSITPGGKYYVVKNGSAIFAFIAGTAEPNLGFRLSLIHI